MNKKEAWEFAFGMIQVDHLTPSDELIALAKQEIMGEISTDDIINKLNKKYRENDNL